MPRALFIPTIGDVLVLAEDWTFTLHREYRNHKFADDNFDFNYTKPWFDPEDDQAPREVTLPKGTHLKLARIYLRNGFGRHQDYDSITFFCNAHLKGKAAKAAIKGRFWAALTDVNKIIIE